MNQLAKLKQIKEIHDRRQQIAMALVKQSKATLARLNSASSELDRQMLEADHDLRESIQQLLATTRSPDHYWSLATNVAVRRLSHRETRSWLGHQRSKMQEDIKLAVVELEQNRARCNVVSGKQEKFRSLIENETQAVVLNEDLKEEEETSDAQLQAAGVVDAG
ncbi:MAG: hypothetical protein QNJ44_21480 [Rhodobacter sp.]|nr:hypothetical protein [Rhodobacter sp.]